MADRSYLKLWPWLLALIVVGLAVWAIVGVTDPRGSEGPGPVGGPDAGGSPPIVEEEQATSGAAAEQVIQRTEAMRAAVRRYEDECVARLEVEAGRGMGAIVADCIEQLGEAIDAVAAGDTVGGVAIDERLVRFRERVSQLRSRPPGQREAAPVRAALLSAANVLGTIQEERYTESVEAGDALTDLRQAARGLDPDRPLADQQEDLRRAFQRAAAMLSAMARPGDPGPGAGD